jgi:tetratricopeptide (TPR) repeat protein
MHTGYIAIFDGEHDRAMELITQAARLNPFGRYGIALGMALFSAKRYDEAIGSLKTARGRLPHVHAFLAASYAHAGKVAEAKAAALQLIEVARTETAKVDASPPDNWLTFLAEKFPYRDRADLDHLLNGLRIAGVPD